MTLPNPEQLRELVAKKEKGKEHSAEAARLLMEKADAIHTFQYQGIMMSLQKLPIPDALRIIAKLPQQTEPCPACQGNLEKANGCEKCKGDGEVLRELSTEEQAVQLDIYCEALAIANVDGYSKEQIGRMTPPEYPPDFLGKAWAFLLHMNQMTKTQVESLGFFRRKP